MFALLDRRYAPVPDPRRVEWVDSCTYAHRGLHGGGLHGSGVPENSLAAFAAAVERGFGIELDVQLSSDGQPMVFHDWELDRMTGQSGAVAARGSAELRTLHLLGTAEVLQWLPAVLQLVAGKVPLLIEIKSRQTTRIAPACVAVRRALEGYLGPHAIISFDPRVTRWFARFSPLTTRGLSFTEGADTSLPARLRRRFSFWHGKPDFITYDIRDLPNSFATAQRNRGLKLVTWTIASPQLGERAMACADAIIAEGAGIG